MFPLFISPKVDSPEDSRPRQKKEVDCVVLLGVAGIEPRMMPDKIPKLNDPQRCDTVDDGYNVRVKVIPIASDH